MIIKIAIGFVTTDSNAKFGVSVDTITSAMTANTHYPERDSGIAEVVTLNTEFKTATVAAEGGGKALTADRNTKRAALAMRVRSLAAYVQANGKNDENILLSSGFSLQKMTRTRATILPAPLLQSIRAGRNTGTVTMKLEALDAQTYNWRCFRPSAPEVTVSAMQSTAATMLFSELTPGESYCFQGNAVNSAGTSDWSIAVPLIVT